MLRILALFIFSVTISAQAQETVLDTVPGNPTNLKFSYKQLIIPGALIGFGAFGIKNDQLLGWNAEIKEELNENIDEKFTIDDISQYAPFVSVYALNLAGVKGKNNLRDRTVIIATSYLIVSTTVLGLKSIIHEERPDGSSDNSFPSGHTATAFAGAEFLRQEYKDVSIWYGVAGYTVAAGTGFFRMYNDRHWFTDVATGAGIGILSTKIAYWVNPYITRKLFGTKEKNGNVMLTPFYNGKQTGVGLAISF